MATARKTSPILSLRRYSSSTTWATGTHREHRRPPVPKPAPDQVRGARANAVCQDTNKYLDRIVRVRDGLRAHVPVRPQRRRLPTLARDGLDLVLHARPRRAARPSEHRAPLRIARLFAGLVLRTDCSTAAGFLHFVTGFFLVTGLLQDSRDQLAARLRHGLI